MGLDLDRALDRVHDAQARFMAAIAGLTDDEVRQPSLLPDWTVAHVLAHVARNADSHARRAEAAARGVVVEQYPGGFEGRAAEIEASAVGRSARTLIDDVRASAAAMWDVWSATPSDCWENETRDVGGRVRPLSALLGRRWQELEVHVVDLDVGVTHRAWPGEFVAEWLPKLRAGRDSRLPAGASVPPAGLLDERDELAWLYGRLQRPDLPDLAPWA